MITHPAGEEVPVTCGLCGGEGFGPGPCPKCKGSGTEVRALTEDLEVDSVTLLESLDPPQRYER